MKKIKPLKVLFLATNVKESATYFRAFHLAKQLVSMGHDVTLMAVSGESRFKSSYSLESNVKIVETPNFLYNNFFSARIELYGGAGVFDIAARIKEAMSSEYDVIQMFDHFPNIAIPFYYLKRKLGSKFVSDWCDLYHLPGGSRETYGTRFDFIYNTIGFPFRKWNRFVETDLRRKADAVTVISRKLREIALEKGGDKGKVFLIEGGADVDTITPLPKREVRKRLGVPVNAKVVEFMGRCQNDLDVLMKSFVKIKNDVPNSSLLVVGERREWIKRLALSLGIGDSYIAVGRCSDDLLPAYLSCADLLALPLRNNVVNEARWANKFGEYLASGRPIVISDVGDQPAIVKKFETGLVADNSIEDFSRKMAMLLRNRDLSERMGQNARRTACDYFTWKRMAKKLENIYYAVL